MKKSSSCSLFFIFLFFIIHKVNGGYGGRDSHASIKSKYGQLVTSSTLKWRPTTRQKMVFYFKDEEKNEAVESGTGNPINVVCRAEHHGSTLLGHTVKSGECAVAFVNKVYL